MSAKSASEAGPSNPIIVEVPPIVGLCSVSTGALEGLRFRSIEVEVASRRGPSMFVMAGLAETSVRESRVRVTSALAGLGITLEEFALTVSLAPADVRKNGSALDLAVAISILGAIGHLDPGITRGSLFLGELGLDGAIRPIRGVLPLLEGARPLGIETAYVPSGNAAEASHSRAMTSFAVGSLAELVAHLRGSIPLAAVSPSEQHDDSPDDASSLDDVFGQDAAKRALTIAAAGHHNLLLSGPPGSGKSLLARRLPGLLPSLELSEALEVSSIHSIVGLVDPSVGLVRRPPFRAPHHTVSEAGLVGGGAVPRPGELSLAHRGVLFLDELPEFRRNALEALRQPLEDGRVSVVRARQAVEFPARPIVVAAMNPCPCGHYRNPQRQCSCSPETRSRYLKRLSGPLLERIDLLVSIPPVPLHELGREKERSHSEVETKRRVLGARTLQRRRSELARSKHPTNSELTLPEALAAAQFDDETEKFLIASSEKLALSARSYLRVLRVARTIADLEASVSVRKTHLAEALGYRIGEGFF